MNQKIVKTNGRITREVFLNASADGLPIDGGMDADTNADEEESGERSNGNSPQVVHFWDLCYNPGPNSTAGPGSGSQTLCRVEFASRRGTPKTLDEARQNNCSSIAPFPRGLLQSSAVYQFVDFHIFHEQLYSVYSCSSCQLTRTPTMYGTLSMLLSLCLSGWCFVSLLPAKKATTFLVLSKRSRW